MPRQARNKAKAKQPTHRPIVRFDTFGTVKQVLAEVDAVIPRLFPKRAAGFKSNLKKLIRTHSEANKWDTIALTVSQGMARAELDAFIEGLGHHHGPIVIDPTARTPDHQTFDSPGLVRVNKERMVMVNEATDDVLVILHGLDHVSTERKMDLLQKTLIGIAAALGIAATQLGVAPDKNAESIKNLLKAQENLKKAREKLNKKKALEKKGKTADSDKKDDLDKDADDDISQEMFMSLALLAQLQRQLQEDPQLEYFLESIMLQIQRMPEKFDDLKVSYQPYEAAAMRLLNVQTGAYVAEPQFDPHQQPDNTPDPKLAAQPPDPHHHLHKYHSLHVPRLLPD